MSGFKLFSSWKYKEDPSGVVDHVDGIPGMKHTRFYASSVLNEDGDMWVIGGAAPGSDNASDTTEVYTYLPRGKGKWRTGPALPPAYRDTGIESHCTVR